METYVGIIASAALGIGVVGARYLSRRTDDATSRLSPWTRATDRDDDAEEEPIEEDNQISDRERVRRLLADDGGRCKQSRLVERTGWSKAKVSRLLGEMASDGEVVKVQLGRENLICLPGKEPGIARAGERLG